MPKNDRHSFSRRQFLGWLGASTALGLARDIVFSQTAIAGETCQQNTTETYHICIGETALPAKTLD